jgi:FAD/FMN-containing dehydrogenase
MNRRGLLQRAAVRIPFVSGMWSWLLGTRGRAAVRSHARVRPGDPGWPSEASWNRLSREVGGRLVKVRSPLAACADAPSSVACASVFKDLKNPYYLGDEVGLTQSLGWVDAWTSRPSVYAVAARTTDDVVAAVNFARENNLRVVVKGGGHSYQGTSNAADSLLIWTRKMSRITVHDAFAGAGGAGEQAPQPAVTVGAGAIWGHVYDAVTTKASRYVQGGGCMTVGVAGLIQSGGFGSFSKAYGMAAASLLEAEIVTADGAVRIANARTNPDLFWGLKGGGGGSLGAVTRLTLRTHDLPEFFGAAFMTIKATSDAAFRRLIGRVVGFYGESLFNPHWGEQIAFRPGNALAIAMVFQGLDQQQAKTIWRPFLDWVAGSPQDFSIESEPWIASLPAQRFWDPRFLKGLPGIVLTDDRPRAPEANVFWAANLGEAGQVLHGYQSAWLPASLLHPDRQESLADALFAASRHWRVSLHFNKGLAGAPADAVAAARDTAMNPAVLDAFALLISAAEGPPASPGVPGHEPDLSAAREHARAIDRAMTEIRALLPTVSSYVAESNFFEPAWNESFWGANYARLLAVKDKYDPDGLFFVHHGVGAERWSGDGFTRLPER